MFLNTMAYLAPAAAGSPPPDANAGSAMTTAGVPTLEAIEGSTVLAMKADVQAVSDNLDAMAAGQTLGSVMDYIGSVPDMVVNNLEMTLPSGKPPPSWAAPGLRSGSREPGWGRSRWRPTAA